MGSLGEAQSGVVRLDNTVGTGAMTDQSSTSGECGVVLWVDLAMV